jgi:hypothetical protein
MLTHDVVVSWSLKHLLLCYMELQCSCTTGLIAHGHQVVASDSHVGIRWCACRHPACRVRTVCTHVLGKWSQTRPFPFHDQPYLAEARATAVASSACLQCLPVVEARL